MKVNIKIGLRYLGISAFQFCLLFLLWCLEESYKHWHSSIYIFSTIFIVLFVIASISLIYSIKSFFAKQDIYIETSEYHKGEYVRIIKTLQLLRIEKYNPFNDKYLCYFLDEFIGEFSKDEFKIIRLGKHDKLPNNKIIIQSTVDLKNKKSESTNIEYSTSLKIQYLLFLLLTIIVVFIIYSIFNFIL